MLNNHLKIAVRNVGKRKGYAALNILGLTIGMACCLLIFHYVSYERSYDDFHQKGKDIVRLRLDNYQKGQLAWRSATVYPAIGPTLKKDFPEVENFTRLYDATLRLNNPQTNAKFVETQGYYADQATLDMFNIQVIRGNAATSLDAPDKMLLSESMAKKYFGSSDPVGRQLVQTNAEGTRTFQITGVFKDYPANSHLDIEYLVSYKTLASIATAGGDTSNATETSWGWYDFYTYLQLKPGTDWKTLEAKLPAFADRYINSQEWYKTNNNKGELYLIPMQDIHLYSNVNQEAEVNGNGQAVAFLLLVAIFIIGIAWVNYINLSTARSVERAREVGVRKVMGALRQDLVRQFLVESLLLNLIALVFAIGLFYALLPAFDKFTGRETATGFALTSAYWLMFLALFVAGTLLSGIYPAFVLSGFQPVTVLKGAFKNTAGGQGLRKGLIVAQFIISVVLIAGTIIVYQQVSYMRNQQLGFNMNQTLVLKGAGSLQDSAYAEVFQPFKNELLQQNDIRYVSASSNVMGNEIYWTSGVMRLGITGQSAVTLYHMGIDQDFIPAFDMKLVAGRNFSSAFGTDERSVLLNEEAVRLLGFKDANEALNTLVRRGRTDSLKVVGVVSNFHHEGLQKQIQPMIFLFLPNTRNYYSLKVETGNMQRTISNVQAIWNKYFPGDPVNYFFLDESFNKQYKADTLFGKVFGTFAILAIVIACFGLMGLSAYNVLQRTKEIGIRKVLGATGQNLLLMLSKDFLRLIMVALVLSIPLAWYIMHQWLQDFAYRINIRWWVFAMAGVLALAIAFVTISMQVMKALNENPVKSLRTE
ncbi:MAG TPA: ABC transporter permease [Chitinophagaceae bacterium]|nr:ABC transporter permease [Chitinophagaceae bacterium]